MLLGSKFLIKKKFSQIAHIRFQRKAKDAKNYIYFASEKDFAGSNPIINNLRTQYSLIIKDIKKKKFGIIYTNPNSDKDKDKDDQINKSETELLTFADRICLVSTPENSEKLRSVASSAFKFLVSHQVERICIGFSNALPLHHRRLIITSLILSNYNFKISGNVIESDINDTNDKSTPQSKYIKEFIFDFLNDSTNIDNIDSYKLWVNLANATLYTRNLANQRPNIANCDYLEDVAKQIIYSTNTRTSSTTQSTNKLKIEVIKGEQLLEKGLNLVHAVGRSAATEPRVIILSYKGDPTTNINSHAIVGKGLTFDTGGLNLKPTNYIEDMYLDKHGACNVLSIFKSVVEMDLKINLVCAIGVAENSIDGVSYKPSDIITSHKGYTVEITNTDAEGRLVLADTLSYLQAVYRPRNIIDLATLTGACMIALGNRTAGLFTNNKKLAADLVTASEEVLEPIWHLPINNEHREDLKSNFADLKNAGKDRYGGASKGAAFLEKFIDKGVNWAHLDIAGPSHALSSYDCWSSGATGFGTQLVLKYLYNAVNKSDVISTDYLDPSVSSKSENTTLNHAEILNLKAEDLNPN